MAEEYDTTDTLETMPLLVRRETPRLCRGGSRSLTFT